jgi:hypothetical protein
MSAQALEPRLVVGDRAGVGERRLRHRERVDEQLGVVAHPHAQRVDVLDDGLRALRREAAVLLVPAALGLDAIQRVEAAEAVARP